MQHWGDEELQRLSEELAHVDSHIQGLRKSLGVEEQQDAQDPFDYTPWIAALPMHYTKEIEQGLRVNGLKLRKQTNSSRSQEEPLAVGRSKKARISSQCP